MKFTQLIEYHMINIFLKKLHPKFVGEASARLVSEKIQFNISLDQQSEMS